MHAAALGKNSRRLFPPKANVRLLVTVCQKKLPAFLYFYHRLIRLFFQNLWLSALACWHVCYRDYLCLQRHWIQQHAMRKSFCSNQIFFITCYLIGIRQHFIHAALLSIEHDCICSSDNLEVMLIAQSQNFKKIFFASSLPVYSHASRKPAYILCTLYQGTHAAWNAYQITCSLQMPIQLYCWERRQHIQRPMTG